jgi:A/G-specific adenine glycosylase
MKKEINQPVFTRLLMLWNKKYNKRLMPWKGEKDPYKIWVSEIILQQTRVEQGMDYYLRFIKKYPTVKKLAAAEDNEVFKIWEGLGYYSRCKNLLSAARFIVETHKGKFPESYKDILELKGVGPYTAAAIASFAYNLPFAVVDGNVNRVLARFFGIKTPIDSANGKQQFNELATRVLDSNNAGLYNQAIMDFGATLCKPQLPHCDVCIMQSDCKAYAQNRVSALPVKEKKILKKNRWFIYVIAEHENKILVKKRSGKDIWHNLHEFILIETNTLQSPEQVIQSEKFKAIAGKKQAVSKISTNFKQTLTHQFIHAFFIHIRFSKSFIPEGMEWIAKDDLKKLAFPKLIHAYIEQVMVD